MPTSTSKRRRHKPSRTPQILIIGSVVLLVIMILIFKQDRNTSNASEARAGDLPAVQLDRALQAGQPILAFFHSNNCHQCIVMMETVTQVYPEFSSTITLVDVNVYDEYNAALLQRVGLQYIPTLIFYDHIGQGQVSVGVMEAEQLRQTLAVLAAGE
jgi:thiol:disulfide interchange protein